MKKLKTKDKKKAPEKPPEETEDEFPEEPEGHNDLKGIDGEISLSPGNYIEDLAETAAKYGHAARQYAKAAKDALKAEEKRQRMEKSKYLQVKTGQIPPEEDQFGNEIKMTEKVAEAMVDKDETVRALRDSEIYAKGEKAHWEGEMRAFDKGQSALDLIIRKTT